jgi:hypothetical protein
MNYSNMCSSFVAWTWVARAAVCATLAVGCGSAAPTDAGKSGASAPSNRESVATDEEPSSEISDGSDQYKAEPVPSDEEPSAEPAETGESQDDYDKRYDEGQKQDGFGAAVLPTSCVSKGEDGSIITGNELPVGGGRWLECTTDVVASRMQRPILLTTGQYWCRLAELYASNVDPRWQKHLDPATFIQSEIVSSPPDAPWTLIGRRTGEPIVVGSTDNVVQANALYRVIDGKPMGDSCY